MALNIDTCHICLDKKVEINKIDTCKNLECGGYICNKCWIDIYDRNIEVCPICNKKLEDNYIIKKTNYSFNLSIDFKKMIFNILGYLSY
jgi:hypothetical protein